VLVYGDEPDATVIALGDPASLGPMLLEIEPGLPGLVHAHLSPGIAEVLMRRRRVESRGRFLKLALRDRSRLSAVDVKGVEPLGPPNLREVRAFYERAYPGNYFDPRMLDTSCYVGIREAGELAAVAGVHVYSARYRVAAIGNVATAPEQRGRGLATRATARLCQLLLESTDVIGLNVHADNAAALACYGKLGFEYAATYEELTISSLNPRAP
jgi:RimJ/RimL family protein N-acetyltransferase